MHVHVHVVHACSLSCYFIGVHETIFDGSSLVFKTTPSRAAECVVFKGTDCLD